MNGAELVDGIETAEATPLSRLGSDKYLLAATGADLSTGPVLREAARTAASGRETFAAWADDETGDVAAAFADAADAEADLHDRIVAGLDADAEADADADADLGPDPEDPVHAALDIQTGTVARVAAGFVGRGLVRERTGLQYVNFFVNEGDEGWADRFRAARERADGDVERGADLLDAVCADEADWERARSAAEAVIQAAYDDYAATLEGMGLDPKPVC